MHSVIYIVFYRHFYSESISSVVDHNRSCSTLSYWCGICALFKSDQLSKPSEAGKAHNNMSLANTICGNTFSTSSTSNSRSLSGPQARLQLSAGMYDRCDGCSSLSRIPHNTRPGGNMFVMCMFASRVLRTATNCIENQKGRKGKRISFGDS